VGLPRSVVDLCFGEVDEVAAPAPVTSFQNLRVGGVGRFPKETFVPVEWKFLALLTSDCELVWHQDQAKRVRKLRVNDA